MHLSHKRPTQLDIARALGVAQITVSRALSGHPSVVPAMRDRILAEAARQGYRLHHSATAMKQGRHGAIGLLAGADPGRSATPLQIFWGLEDACFRQGQHLVIGRFGDELLEDANRLPHFLRQWMVDGLLIYYTHAIPGGLRQILEQMQLPYVWINTDEPGAVRPDDKVGSRIATEKLIELGHREIVLLHGETGPGAHYSNAERIEGYQAAMSRAGLEPQPVCWSRSGQSLHEKAVDWVAQCRPFPTAFVATSRWLALALVLAAERHGYTLRDDYSLILMSHSGFENVGLRLTTMKIPTEKMADLALEKLLMLVKGETPPRSRRVAYGFDPGASIGPPRNGFATRGKR